MRKDKIRKVVLDIGNHDLKLLLGEMDSEYSKISVVDYVKIRSKGIRKNIIENSDALYESLEEAVRTLVEKTGYSIDKLSIGLGGSGVNSRTKNVSISFDEKEIDKDDVKNLYDRAKKEIFGRKVSGYYRTLYCEAYNIKINNTKIVRDPVGMVAKELQSDVYIVYIDEDYVEKITEIINKLGIEIDEIYLNSYASAKGTLNNEAKKMGIAHIDIGYGSTDIILLKNSKVIYTKSIQIGEMHYISDLALALGISKENAEEILKKFKNKEIEPDNTIKFSTKKVSIRDIKDTIQARTGDIIDFVISSIEDSGFKGYLAKGITLTGGVADLDGVLEQIKSKVVGYSIRKELPIGIKGLDSYYGDAVVVGIFLEELEKEYYTRMEQTNKKENETEEVLEENLSLLEEDETEEIVEDDELEKEGLGTKVIKFFKEFF